MTKPKRYDVIIVGAGAAGVGMASTLIDFGIKNFKVLDRHEVGASFNRWPEEMRLITPSFNTTPFGILDLNAVILNTSVANFLGEEHPRGTDYARYLQAIVREMQIPVASDWEVVDVEERSSGGFLLTGPEGDLECDYLIWAAGEFQYPRTNHFAGADLCLHNSHVSSYRDLEGDDFIVVGAFESGVDAAVHLAKNGKSVKLLCADKELALVDQDPSRSLSPFTRKRLEEVLKEGSNLQIHYKSQVKEVKKTGRGFEVITSKGQKLSSTTPPILAVGFRGGTGPVEELFDCREDGHFLLSEVDESTYADGLFMSGPLVRHDNHIFCYIYKFRQRFAVIAETIADRLGVPVSDELLELYDRNQMRLVDLSCCGETCVC
ncbi:MAG: NAD(P)/FAD-dependent oxidoreductase [Verrucomicrobiota bacterium]